MLAHLTGITLIGDAAGATHLGIQLHTCIDFRITRTGDIHRGSFR